MAVLLWDSACIAVFFCSSFTNLPAPRRQDRGVTILHCIVKEQRTLGPQQALDKFWLDVNVFLGQLL